MDEARWTITRGREGGEVRRDGVTVATIRLTEGGRFAWRLVDAPEVSGTENVRARAAEAAREAWKGRLGPATGG